MYNEESLSNINNKLSTEWINGSTFQDLTNLRIVYNNPSIERSADFSQVHGDQINNGAEWSTDLDQDKTAISLPNIYNNSFIKRSTDFTNNNPLIERNTDFTQAYNNSIIHVSLFKSINVQNDIYPVSCKECKSRSCYDSNICENCYRAPLQILSGDKLIDDFIKSTQTLYKSCRTRSKLEFIPYKQFTNLKYIAKGGFSVIYKATWVDGPITHWNNKSKRYYRKKDYDVVLKILNYSEKMDYDLLNELKNFFHCIKNMNNDEKGLQKYLGITQHPEAKNYIMVIEFAQNGDLHYFLNKNENTLSWIEKLVLLHDISIGLTSIHKQRLIHRDLHSGNILIGLKNKATITDLGISQFVGGSSNENAIYGVIPYVAPEVLNGGKFTQASDIYSFGMIIWEVISGRRPFSDHKHDEYLILDILDGLRPKIPINTPQELVELMERCWHQDPEKRRFMAPDRKQYKFITCKWLEKQIIQRGGDLTYEFKELIYKAINGEIRFTDNEDINILPTKINDQAFYSSRSPTPLTSKALTLQSMRLNSNAITVRYSNGDNVTIKQ